MLKLLGVILVTGGASASGFFMALQVRQTTALLLQLLSALEQMKNEIEYRKTALPELIEMVSHETRGAAASFFRAVAGDLRLRRDAGVSLIFKRRLAEAYAFPASVRHILTNLAGGLGSYDVCGQLRSIDFAILRLRSLLEQLQRDQRARVRSYCTLGVCGGLALAIMLL